MPACRGEFIPHSLRHLYASTVLAEGIPITEASRWLGHESVNVTHQIYGHLVPSSFDRARNALDRAYQESQKQRRPGNGAESVLVPVRSIRHLPAATVRWSTITQIYEGINQI